MTRIYLHELELTFLELTFPDHSFVWHVYSFHGWRDIFTDIESRFGGKLSDVNKDGIWGAFVINTPGEDSPLDGGWKIKFFARDLQTLLVIKLLT